jgi:hypothetical protein
LHEALSRSSARAVPRKRSVCRLCRTRPRPAGQPARTMGRCLDPALQIIPLRYGDKRATGRAMSAPLSFLPAAGPKPGTRPQPPRRTPPVFPGFWRSGKTRFFSIFYLIYLWRFIYLSEFQVKIASRNFYLSAGA